MYYIPLTPYTNYRAKTGNNFSEFMFSNWITQYYYSSPKHKSLIPKHDTLLSLLYTIINPYCAGQILPVLCYVPSVTKVMLLHFIHTCRAECRAEFRLPIDIQFVGYSWDFSNQNSIQMGCLSAVSVT